MIPDDVMDHLGTVLVGLQQGSEFRHCGTLLSSLQIAIQWRIRAFMRATRLGTSMPFHARGAMRMGLGINSCVIHA